MNGPHPHRWSILLVLLFGTTTWLRAQESEESRLPVRINGGLSASLSNYQSSDSLDLRDPFTYLLNGNVTISRGQFSVPINLTVSQQRKDLSASVFKRYGASPSWSWGRAHLGYRSMQFSSFTVAGATFLGAGLELEPSIVRIAGLAGRFEASREAQPEENIAPRYRRRGYGLKLGVGTDNNHLDLIYFEATEDTSSLEVLPPESDLTARENVVVGVNAKFRPISEIGGFFEIAASALNRDISAPKLETDIPNVISDIFQPRESIQANLALRAGLDLNLREYGLQLEYRRVDPDYETLGAYFFNTDVESITIGPRATFAQGRINLSGSIGISHNNLYDDLAQTTDRFIGSANASFRISRAFNLNTQYSNYSSDQSSGVLESTDSTRVKNVSQNFMISPRYQFGQQVRQSIGVRIAFQDFQQTNVFTDLDSDTRSTNLSLNYSVNLTQRALRLNFNASNLRSEAGTRETTSRGISATVSKSLLENALSLDTRLGLRNREIDGGSTTNSLTGSLGVNYNPTRFDSFSLRSQFARRGSDVESVDTLSDVLTTISYSRRFSI